MCNKISIATTLHYFSLSTKPLWWPYAVQKTKWDVGSQGQCNIFELRYMQLHSANPNYLPFDFFFFLFSSSNCKLNHWGCLLVDISGKMFLFFILLISLIRRKKNTEAYTFDKLDNNCLVWKTKRKWVICFSLK